MLAFRSEQRYTVSFDAGLLPSCRTDTLVIGAGVSGLRAAIAAAAYGRVLVLASDGSRGANTWWAQGGVAAPVGRDDSVDQHLADTLATGGGLCDPVAARFIIERSRCRLEELVEWGLRIDRDGRGRPALGLEGGHSRRRVVHVGGDATGKALVDVLLARVRSDPMIAFVDRCFVIDLITPDSDTSDPAPVFGALVHVAGRGLSIVWARATVLASGGAAGVYRESTNPPSTTGDGIAMAFRAGALVRDMAFVQFHPTAFAAPTASQPLISEAVRGEGSYLVDENGLRFMLGFHPMAELAPRDVVSRAIVKAQGTQGDQRVFLDARHIRGLRRRFPGLTSLLADHGLDPGQDLIPVTPAAHYSIGGVATDLFGRTSLPGLYAAGEVASTGLHGANRLASNSLLEGLVMGEAAGRAAAERVASGVDGDERLPTHRSRAEGGCDALSFDDKPGEGLEAESGLVASELRALMWNNVGIVRSSDSLLEAIARIDAWRSEDMPSRSSTPRAWKLSNMLLVSSLIARAALWRRESRGCHFRTDAPAPDPAFATHDTWLNTTADRPAPSVHDHDHLFEAVGLDGPNAHRALPRPINGITR